MLIFIILSIMLLIGNALFVATEFGLIAAKKDKLMALPARKSAAVARVLHAQDQLALMLSGCQFGITLCSIFLGLMTEPLITKLLEQDLGYSHLSIGLIRVVSLLGSLFVVVSCHMFFGELIPKNIALAGPEKIAIVLTPFITFFVRCTEPLLSLYVKITFVLLRLIGITAKNTVEKTFSPQKLSILIALSHEAGLIDELEFIRLTRTLDSQERTVGEIAQPISEMIVLTGKYYPDGTFGPSVKDVETVILQSGFSRYPVVDNAGYVHGYVHVKDLLHPYQEPQHAIANPEKNPIEDPPTSSTTYTKRNFSVPVRTMPIFPASSKINAVVSALRYNGCHLGKVINSDGSLLGIVALEDLVSEFIDTVRDETDRINFV